MKKILKIFLVFILLSQSALADEVQEGLNALNRGDYKTAFEIWKPLAKEGNSTAQFNLGLMYRNGEGVPQDYKTAAKWYTLAAEQGYLFAQVMLAKMYRRGEGVPQDYVYAYMWGNIAASNGNESGRKLRDVVAKEMTAAQIAKAEQLAQECVRKEYKGC